jgi:hypothetical protein
MRKLLINLTISGGLLACDCAIPRTWYYYFQGNLKECIEKFKKSMNNKNILFEKIDYLSKHGSVIYKINNLTISNICDGNKKFAYVIISGCDLNKENEILGKIKQFLQKAIL